MVTSTGTYVHAFVGFKDLNMTSGHYSTLALMRIREMLGLGAW